MASVNKVILVATLGQEPNVSYMPNGKAAVRLSLATNEVWKDKAGQRQERTEWHTVVAYDRLAEFAGEYFKKGTSVYVEGKLHTRKWEKDGVTRYSTEIVADTIQPNSPVHSNKGEGGQQAASAAPAGNAGEPAAFEGRPDFVPDDFDDDIPF